MSDLSDFDIFYYYGQNDLQMEIESDIQQNVVQGTRSLFYNRSNDSSGLDEFENIPNAITQTIIIPYNVVAALAKRNTYVGDGQNGTRDRRIVISQNTVKLRTDGNMIDISVFYIPLFNINAAQATTIKLPAL